MRRVDHARADGLTRPHAVNRHIALALRPAPQRKHRLHDLAVAGAAAQHAAERVLDCGGGPGRYAVELTRWGYDVTLFDLSSGNLTLAQKKAAEAGMTLDGFEQDGFPAGEHLDKGNILPLGNPWYWDPAQLSGSQAAKKRRLLDTAAFLYGLQNAFYDRYVKAMREAGYGGEIVAELVEPCFHEPEGKPIEGFTAQNCVPFSGDALAHHLVQPRQVGDQIIRVLDAG